MVSREFISQMAKVELHVHMEGSIRPETVLKLSQRNGVSLPADTVEGLRAWFEFSDFKHFVEVYVGVTKTIKTADDIELIAREFLEGQKAQNILHSEVTYTASTIDTYCGIPWPDQLAALSRAREYGEQELGVTMLLILDIVRGHTAERALEVAQWAVGAMDQGVGALGLAGEEGRGTSQEYMAAFDYARAHGLPIIPHAGETQGAWSVEECLRDTGAKRIGHGVRCLEDPAVVQQLIEKGVVLEVCPSSNVCLKVVPSLAEHPFQKLRDAGLTVTVNSDDPPMFNTTLTLELQRVSDTFGLSEAELVELQRTAVVASLASPDRKAFLLRQIDLFCEK
ncbi:adenosine deaminase [soil metagenome]